MSSENLVPWLEGRIPHSNAYKVSDTYVIYVSGERLTVQVLDLGKDSDKYRYAVHVRNESTGVFSELGNGGATPQEALDVFHWQEVTSPEEG